jgi:ceramide glucosyltransferase
VQLANLDDLLPSVLAVAGLGGVMLSLIFHRAARAALDGEPISRRVDGDAELPAISILKPLKGIDDELMENLASFARQDYPGFELLLGASDPHDPALEVAERLQRAFPEVTIRIVKGPGDRTWPGRHAGAENPKVENLLRMESAARHEWLLISDSNVRVEPDYLRALARDARRGPAVALVHNLIGGRGERTLGAALENAHLNSFIASSVAAADRLAGHPCVVGKSMLLQRRHLQEVGGLRAVLPVLAEDYVLGQRLHRRGFGVVLSSHAIATINRDWTVARFVSRHLRWAQLRRQLCPAAYLGEPIVNPLPWLLGLVALRPGMGAVAAAALLLRYASEAVLARRLRRQPLPWTAVAVLPLKDLLSLGIWFCGGLMRTVEWRGQRLRVGRGTVLLPAPRSP